MPGRVSQTTGNALARPRPCTKFESHQLVPGGSWDPSSLASAEESGTTRSLRASALDPI